VNKLKLISPSSKTVDSELMDSHITYILEHIETLFHFYNFKSAPFNFHAYQGRQKVDWKMATILLSGDKKYNKQKRRKPRRIEDNGRKKAE
ncbi:hypothetical protein BDF21DRAFT_316499, partial [Thamnidium elegans]